MARPRRATGVALAIAALVALLSPLVASAETIPDDSPAAQQLAERFTPIAMLKIQPAPCSTDGEPYTPAPVDIVLNDSAVLLRTDGGGDRARDPVIDPVPSAAALAAAPEGSYLDLPGRALRPGCAYERFERARLEPPLEPTTYARVVIDPEAEKVVLQYWFFYVYNDFNNKHEGDWEMIQLLFDTTSVEATLTMEPERVGYAQHGGGELAEWDDDKLHREGDHPIVYAASGSHASQYESALYIGWGENGTGFGCDTTLGPSARVPLNPVLIPADPSPAGDFAWLLFQGRWGERQSWEFNGPRGPNLGGKWNTPVGAMESWRSSSLRVPGSNLIGPSTTDIFCSVSASGASLLMIVDQYPWALALVAAAIIAIIVIMIIPTLPGLMVAIWFYGRHWHLFLQIGLVTIPIGIIFNAIQIFSANTPPFDFAVKYFEDTTEAHYFLTIFVSGIQQVAMLLIVAPAIIQAMADIHAFRPTNALRCYVQGFRRIRVLGDALAKLLGVIIILQIVPFSLPIIVWVFVRWQFFGQAVILDGVDDAQTALDTSSDAVYGRWWPTLRVTIIYQLLAGLPGPLIGLVLLIGGTATVQFANSLSGVIYAVTIPVTVIALTVYYTELRNILDTSPEFSGRDRELQPEG